MSGVVLAWLTQIALQTWRYEQNNPASLPPPAIYVKDALAFSIVGLVAQAAPQPATLFAWALVVGSVVNQNLFAPANTPAPKAKTGSKTPPSSSAATAQGKAAAK